MIIDEILNLLSDANAQKYKVAITGHRKPDGDCTGASFGLYHFIKRCYPDITLNLFLEQPPENLWLIKGAQEMGELPKEGYRADILFLLDCTPNLLETFLPIYENAKQVVNIDHHPSNDGSHAQINYIDTTASATCELIYNIVGSEHLNHDIAFALYVGLIHDTGVFQYSNTTPKTLQAAAELIKFDIGFNKIIKDSFYMKTLKQQKMLGIILERSAFLADGVTIAGVIDKATRDEIGLPQNEMGGMVSQLVYTKESKGAVYGYELDNGDIKYSLRASDDANMSKVAVALGGGGHKKAAGVTMHGSIEETLAQIEKVLCEARKD